MKGLLWLRERGDDDEGGRHQHMEKDDNIMKLAEQINDLAKLGARQVGSEVDDLIARKVEDHMQIERLLDKVFDFAICDEGLAVFKKLCRYYYPINPEVTAKYVMDYKELYDSDED